MKLSQSRDPPNISAPEMVTSSPGYAIFRDLRNSMGASSSQPLATPGRDANASMVASPTSEPRSHFGPREDDMAASQQLLDEGAHANLTHGDVDSKPTSGQKRRNKHKAKSPAKTQDTTHENHVPPSSPFPFPATHPEADGAVEVPDSQIAAMTADAPAPSPKSSLVVPSSVTKSKRTYKKSKQTRRDQATQDMVDELADTNMGADEPASPSHTTSQRKRQRARDARVGSLETAEVGFVSNTAHPPAAAADATPTPAKRRKIGSPKSATTVQDLFQTSPYKDDDLQRVEKTKLKRVKKPQTPMAKAKDIYDIPDDEPNTAKGNCHLQETATRRRSNAKKKKVKDGKVYDWPASVRKPGHPLSETSPNQDYMMQDPISSDDQVSSIPPPKCHQSEDEDKVQKKKKKARPSVASARKLRRNNGDGISLLSSAERALNMDRELGHPPDVRATGDFTDDEEELIRRAVKDFQQRKGLEISELVEIIQWNHYDPSFNREPGYQRNKNDWAPQDMEDARESAEFWEDIRNIGMIRPHDRLRRHIRQLYHQFKSGAWTEEEDQQLRNLHALHTNQWKLISITMGNRSTHDCVNRWRDYLQYGDSRKTSRWSEEEEQLLIRAVTTIAQRDEDFRAESGRPPLTEYTNKDISWPQVAHEMGDSRSRIQASVKWTKMMRRENPPRIQLEYKPRAFTAQSQPQKTAQTSELTPKKRGRRPKGDATNGAASEKRPKTQKSAKYCFGSDQESEGLDTDKGPSNPPPKKKRGRPRKSETTATDKPEKHGKSSTAVDQVADETEKQVEGQVEQDDMEEDQVQEDQDPVDAVQDQPAALSPDQPPKSDKSVAPGVDQMLWGDKYDVIFKLQDRRDDYEEDIDWEDVAKEQSYPWSLETLQTALHQLIDLLRNKGRDVDMDDFPGTVDDVMDFISEKHGAELEQHYTPS